MLTFVTVRVVCFFNVKIMALLNSLLSWPTLKYQLPCRNMHQMSFAYHPENQESFFHVPKYRGRPSKFRFGATHIVKVWISLYDYLKPMLIYPE